MLNLQTAVRRAAVFLDRWHWALLALAAPFLLFPAPGRSLALLVVPGLWVVAWLAGREPLPRTPFNGALLLLSLAVLVSLYATYDIAVSLPKVAGMVLGLGVFYAVVRVGQRPRGWWLCGLVFVTAGVGVAGLGLLGIRWIAKVGFLAPIISHLPSALVSLPGASEGLHPNEVAGTLLWVIPVLVSFLWLTFPHLRNRWAVLGWCLAVAATLFVTGVFVLTQSRGGYIGFALAGPALILIALPPRVRRFSLGGLAVLAIVAVIVVSRYGADPVLRELIGGARTSDPALSLDSLEGRVEVWSRAIYAIQDFPFTGMGMNTFRRIVPVLYPLFLVSPDFDIAHAHNEFLQAALDLGLSGLIAFLALYIGAFWMLFEIWRLAPRSTLYAPQSWRFLVLGLGGGLFAHMLYGLTDAVALGAKPGLLLWMLLGLVAALFEQARSSRPEAAEGTARV